MAFFKLSSKQKLIATIAISFAFFVAEISVAFYTKSLALLADAFHYLNDLIGFVVALVAIIISERANSPQNFSFGWARAQLLGAFFNGVFLLALGLSILLQSIERFISLEEVQNPKLVLIVGSVGLALNLISVTLLHEHHGHDHGHGHSHGHGHGHSHSDDWEHAEESGHDHAHGHRHSHRHSHSHSHVNVEAAIPAAGSSSDSANDVPLTPISAHAEHRHTILTLKSPGRDLGMLGVLIHVIGDALNNIGVIISALVIWLAHYQGRFYADPGVSLGIAISILLSSLPLVKNSGKILMQSAPIGLNLDDVKHDLEKIPGIESVHELHIWRLDQTKAIASAHIVVSNNEMTDFMERARTVGECLHAYGIHSATLQPELASPPATAAGPATTTAAPAITPTSAGNHGDLSNTSGGSAADKDESNGGNVGVVGAGAGAGAAVEVPAAVKVTTGASAPSIRRRRTEAMACQIACGNLCENLTCCNTSGVRL